MTDWVVVLFGLALLALVLSERAEISNVWWRPTQWRSQEPDDGQESPALAQPGNVIIGVPLSFAAILYGMVSFLN